ncbi:MAG TPA: hexitol phosphatase HxpB [Chitinophagaceae bacterium]|nr:hexitol phosphatase HxpB [Chitinophagaceae bacterium]
MRLNTVIFDMDGLLINSEPLWNEAANEVFAKYNVSLTDQDYRHTTGLRTKEFIEWWMRHFNITDVDVNKLEQEIFDTVMGKVSAAYIAMPGMQYIFNFFTSRQFKIGIASSSPKQLIELVMEIYNLTPSVHHHASAHLLKYAKPHPEVYINCAEILGAHPLECICFEDSFAGMIAAKAARMKCVVVPDRAVYDRPCWGAADIVLPSLNDFGEDELQLLIA